MHQYTVLVHLSYQQLFCLHTYASFYVYVHTIFSKVLILKNSCFLFSYLPTSSWKKFSILDRIEYNSISFNKSLRLPPFFLLFLISTTLLNLLYKANYMIRLSFITLLATVQCLIVWYTNVWDHWRTPSPPWCENQISPSPPLTFISAYRLLWLLFIVKATFPKPCPKKVETFNFF